MKTCRIIARSIIILCVAVAGYFMAPGVNNARAFAALTFDLDAFINFWKQYANDMAQNWQKNASKIIAQEAKRRLVEALRNKILNPGGSTSGPAMVTNWRDYSRTHSDAGDTLARQVIGDAIWGPEGDTTQSSVCSAFRDSLGQMTGAQRVTAQFSQIAHTLRVDTNETFKDLVKCPLPEKVSVNGVEEDFDMAKFADGSQFNLETFSRIALDPAGSMLGLAMLAQEEKDKQRKQEERVNLNEAMSGAGFTALKNNAGKILTAASDVSAAAKKGMEGALGCLDQVESFNELAPCLLEVVQEQFYDFTNGAGSSGTTPSPSIPPEPSFDPEEQCIKAAAGACAEEEDPDKYDGCFSTEKESCMSGFD